MKGFFRNFVGKFAHNAKADIDHLRGKGAEEKADILYNRIKAAFSGTWNLIIDKIIDLLLRSAKKDAEFIIVECKSHGIDPFTKLPRNVVDKLRYAR